MSSLAISSPLPPNVEQIGATARTGPAQTPQPAPVADSGQDTVELSPAAQAEALYQSGDTVSSISSSLGISVSMVDSYLDITQTVSVPTTVAARSQPAAPAPAPAASTAQPAPVKTAVKG